jgi:hypothetical protein
MINLIPNEEKKKMANNFYYRLAILSFIMMSVSMLFATIAISPSYIIARAKENFVDEKLAIQKSEPVPVLDQATQKAIGDLDTRLSLVEGVQTGTFVVSEKVVNEIIENKIFGIKITRISYENTASVPKISISGTAPSRERLLLFRQSLEDNDAFKGVDLPISNFIQGSDIPFSLTLIPNAQK